VVEIFQEGEGIYMHGGMKYHARDKIDAQSCCINLNEERVERFLPRHFC